MTSTPTLESRLTEAAPRLTGRVLDEMYINPFWQERFGDRGRQHAGRDGGSHIRYLVEALVASNERVFIEYAGWLRGVLVSRGMCSRHLIENFERLASAIEQESWPDRQRAVGILRAGVQALLHTQDAAGAIDAVRGTLAREAAASLWTLHPDWLARTGETGRARCVDDLDYHLSYLVDALAFSDRERFVGYIVFMGEFLDRRAIPVDHLRESLMALSHAIRSRLPTLTEAPFQFLDAARDRIGPAACR